MPVAKKSQSRRAKTSGEIMARLLQPKKADLSSEAARSILRLTFPTEDQARVDLLSSKAQDGTLTPVEREELEEYIRVADLLAMLQSKARLSLKRAGLNSDVP
jgi:hypothetical protein